MPVKRYSDPGTTIQVATGDRFAVELRGNPSTGYMWQADVDSQYLALLGQQFEPGGVGVGAAGNEVFQFHALAIGTTEIDCAYRRPWEKEVQEKRRFRVSIAE